jgi:aurora kinase
MINQRFEIVKKIGEGRSSVYLCGDIEFPDSLIAIKILPPKADSAEKVNFRNEFFTLQKLDHPNILRANEIGTIVQADDEENISIGSPFITLEYFESEELLNSSFIKDELNLKEIVKQICSVLSYLHLSKYIYYDLKPENILVSSKGDKPVIKLIDMGLAVYAPSETDYSITGTAQYIAPELLKKKKHNQSVDLYSLGMLLYKIIYNNFPIKATGEIEIYKAQIEEEFEFPPSYKYSDELIKVVKKLLSKNPEKRYSSSLQVIDDLKYDVSTSVIKDFAPAKTFADRKDVINILSTYINDKTSSEVFVVKGFDGSGKTTLLNKLQETYINSIIINNVKGKLGIDLVKYVIRKLLFSEFIFPFLDSGEAKNLSSFLSRSETEILKQLPAVVSKLSSVNNYIFFIDDYNLFDEFSSEVFKDLIPILQINNIKIILSESSESEYHSTRLNNVREITIGSFTDIQLSELIEKSFSTEFPKEQLNELTLTYSDLLPGSIISFIKDLGLLGIMEFGAGGVEISSDEEKISVLKGSQTQIFNIRLKNLTELEQQTVNILAALDIAIEQGVLAELMELSTQETLKIITNLQVNNIIQKNAAGTALIMTSDGLKKYVYSELQEKEIFHSKLAEKLSGNLPSFSKTELARQYELGKNFDICYDILLSELNDVEKHSSFSYMKKILESMLEVPFSQSQSNQVKFRLSDVNHKLSDFKSVLKIIPTIEADKLDTQTKIELSFIKGSSLIGAGEFESGKKYINSLMPNLADGTYRHKLLTELAYADFDQNKFTEALMQCKNILSHKNLSDELKGKCYNLLGMYEIYQNNDTKAALQWFTKATDCYQRANLPRRIAGMEVNVGNIYNLLGDYNKAEEHWYKSSQINNSIGNLEQEGLLLLNIGVFHLHRQKIEEAITSVNKAYKIFLSLGNELNEGLALLNLGEMHMLVCEYQNAYDSLKHSLRILKKQNHSEELAELYLILGKFYFRIGDSENLGKVIKELSQLLQENELSAKHHNNFNFLQVIERISNNNDVNIQQLKKIIDTYNVQDERLNYTESVLLLIEQLITTGEYETSLEEINSKELIEICEQNIIFEAEREYLLGKISLGYGSDKLLPPIDYFERAYGLIKNESITELTWRVLWALAETYKQRGNIGKSKGYGNYAKELIQFIAEHLSATGLRRIYLQKSERKAVLQI